jgi:hypothetical protein
MDGGGGGGGVGALAGALERIGGEPSMKCPFCQRRVYGLNVPGDLAALDRHKAGCVHNPDKGGQILVRAFRRGRKKAGMGALR